MAHWIIKGRFFECSSCHATFTNYLQGVAKAPECPCCGEPINQEETNRVNSEMSNV